MKKMNQLLILAFLILNTFTIQAKSDLSHAELKDGAVYEINEDISGTDQYKTKTVSFESTDAIHYLKYDFGTNIPTSIITAFKIDISPYTSAMSNSKVYCTNVDSSATDSNLISAINEIRNDESKTTCLQFNQDEGTINYLMKLDRTKTKIAIGVYIPANIQTSAKINLRIKERILDVSDDKPIIIEAYSIIPVTINTQTFRNSDKKASKILFYSTSSYLRMYESESSKAPVELFSGNILNVYTNPDMIRQKYHNASIMTLLAPSIGKYDVFSFQVICLESQFLLDYYVSSNPEGRVVNSPLLINMTDCSNPYYAILNYNSPDTKKTLVLDEIYGKLSSFGIATTLTGYTWEEMLSKDIQNVNVFQGKYDLPANSPNHMDIYVLQCSLPIMLNFYYIDETSQSSKMGEGDVHIFLLEPLQEFNVPFVDDIQNVEVLIEVHQPSNNLNVQIYDGTNDNTYTKNTLQRFVYQTLINGINIKELGGSSDTRVIIKVGYNINKWKDQSPNIKFNEADRVYLFEFPKDAKESFYTFANLTISGTNSDDNVKFCFTTSIGAALKPSLENCYRVSKTNSYTLRLYNPFIMYKTYEFNKELKYSVTLKPVTESQSFGIVAHMSEYDTSIRNYEGINNKIIIDSTNRYSSILTPPNSEPYNIFLQIQVCDDEHDIRTEVKNVLTNQDILEEETIAAGTKNYYRYFQNTLMDTQFYAMGNENVEVFLRMIGLNYFYSPYFNQNPLMEFDQSANTLILESPLYYAGDFKITILIDTENNILNKKYTLCSFVDTEFKDLAKYYKTVTVKNFRKTSIHINFKEAGINVGEKFDALVYYEQLTECKMVFISQVYQDTVGKLDFINVINQTDSGYAYERIEQFKNYYYFSYIPEDIFDVPIGSLSIIADADSSGYLSKVYCTFVDVDADVETMIESVEKTIEEEKSYCFGSQSTVDLKRYNYIFKYVYENNTPKQMVIKVENDNSADIKFNIYVKTNQGVQVEPTDFNEEKEYGQDESLSLTKTVVPYIVDLEKIRGDTSKEYISKVLFYSKNFELQMFYLSDDSNAPIKLFGGNIALVYTKPELAEQKYHSKILILVTENLEGRYNPTYESTFRFHTKMFTSQEMIEFFVSQSNSGRTLNFPLSLEMNTCTPRYNKLYYLLNYNQAESERTLHLEMIYGKYKTAKISTEINQEKWHQLLDSNSMTLIEDYQVILPYKSQHIDVIEIECITPLLINAYYTYDYYYYGYLSKGEVFIKSILAQSSYDFYFNTYDVNILEYSISTYNSIGISDTILTFSDDTQHEIKGNSIQTGLIQNTPNRVRVYNSGEYAIRFIFKYGYAVEESRDWTEVTPQGIEGRVYKRKKMLVYKFPLSINQRNYKNVTFTVNPINNEENIKFCYSTNIGTPIDSSRENCYRTGKNIPYNLTFINPLVMGKDYDVSTNVYYVTFSPFDESEGIALSIKENKYEITNRNELGEAKKLTLQSANVSSILTMPSKLLDILIQIQACKRSSFADSDYVLFSVGNAYTGENLHNGKAYFRDKYGVYYISNLDYMENKVTFARDKTGADIDIYLKHAELYNDYRPNINNYILSFDEDSNILEIRKPISGEAFTITVVVDKDETIKSLTICDLAFSFDKSQYDYVNEFTSTTSDNIVHRIDFKSLNGYPEGTKFYATVYAKQSQNSKMEFVYPAIEAKVGKPGGSIQITKEVEEGKNEYMSAEFKVKFSGNYLYYDFTLKPKGNVASLRINSDEKVSKVGCTFVERTASEEEMQNAVNKAIAEGTSCCVYEPNPFAGSFNALVSANFQGSKSRLVIQVLYEVSGDKLTAGNSTIILKTGGTELTSQGEQNNQEEYTIIPYVIPLTQIRGKDINNYVSKILFYSNSKEMEMLYIPDDNLAPITLFTGNIMLVYTNKDLIRQKYQGAETMILLAKILTSQGEDSIGSIRFRTYFFDSQANIQYFLSSNPDGRPLNNPTTIEMTSCSQPYYYIMNYNKKEGQRKLHIDTVYGEKKSIRIATALNQATWEGLIENMNDISGEEIILELDRFHFDVIEVTCDVPLLINLFYIDPQNQKVDNLQLGEITILSLEKGVEQTLTFVRNTTFQYVYSFTVENEARKPKISLTFNEYDQLSITDNGVYTKYSSLFYDKITIKNTDSAGNSPTRIIFKYGDAIEFSFTPNEYDIYSNKNAQNRIYNLYGYIFGANNKLTYTGVDFEVSTNEDNVKFCYSTNLGTYIYPSLQNCYRVGKSNPYTISVLNPNVMYRDYRYAESLNYYVGFRTVDFNQEIIIKPKRKEYDTNNRNLEGNKYKLTITSDSGAISTILTAPKEHNNYISIEYCLCSNKAHASYEFLNAYNNSNLGYNGEVNDNLPKFLTIENTKLDTELKITKAKKGDEIFLKHIGISLSRKRIASPSRIRIVYNPETKLLNWTQPIPDQNFTYTLYFDTIDTLKPYHFTLCNATTGSKLGRYIKTISTNSRTPGIKVDVENDPELDKELTQFDVVIIAEEIAEFKITVVSATYDSLGGNNEPEPSTIVIEGEDNNVGLVVLISILSVVIIAGIIIAIFVFRKYKSKGQVIKENKQTSMALLNSAKEDKLVESQVQVDP